MHPAAAVLIVTMTALAGSQGPAAVQSGVARPDGVPRDTASGDRTEPEPGCVSCHRGSHRCSYRGPHAPSESGASPGGTLSCVVCHDATGLRATDGGMAPLAPRRAAATCGRCHRVEAERFARSRHAQGVARGEPTAPSCLGCHQGLGPAERARGSTPAERVVTTCTGCHEDPRVLATSNLPMAVVESYEASSHGVALLHGASDVAVCASCHDPHQTLPPSDPRSSVHPANVRATCQRCHEAVDEAMLANVHRPGGWSGPGAWLERVRLFFPIAGRSVSLLLVAGVGAVVGLLSGFFGVGASFLMTPLLIFVGIPAAVAAASDAAHLTAVATSSAVARRSRRVVDRRLAAVLVLGGALGGALGVRLVYVLRELGQFDTVLKLAFVVILGFIGATTLSDALRTRRGTAEATGGAAIRAEGWLRRLPLLVWFPRSGVHASLLLLAGAGVVVGLLSAMLGVGGAFLMLPVLVYVVGVPNRIAVATDELQIILTCGLVALLHAMVNHTVDVLLAMVLFAGSVLGSRVGLSASRRLHGELVGLVLAVAVLVVAAALLWQLLAPPTLPIGLAFSGGTAR